MDPLLHFDKVTLFVPSQLARLNESCLLGVVRIYDGVCYISITRAMPIQDNATFRASLQPLLKEAPATSSRLIGVLSDDSVTQWKKLLGRKSSALNILLSGSDNQINVVKCYATPKLDYRVTLISYTPSDILRSEILFKQVHDSGSTSNFRCADFLAQPCDDSAINEKLLVGSVNFVEGADFSELYYDNGSNNPPLSLEAPKSLLMKLAGYTTIATQLSFRMKQLRFIYSGLKKRQFSLYLGNAISSVLIDVAIGVLFIILLLWKSSPVHWLEKSMSYADGVVNELKLLIDSLIEMPAGLKLNRSLNSALGEFFLYHIYLWRTYMSIVKPVFTIIADSLIFFGIFGFTCLLSIVCDLISLATIHIYCFYGYASRIYRFQAFCLSSLWRLFRGKKWNQLKQRVDSYSYETEQLFIGSIWFTCTIFLLPTVLLYYLVFLVLRLATLCVQLSLRLAVSKLSVLPVYAALLWISRSKKIADSTYIGVEDATSNSSVKFTVLTKQLPIGRLYETNPPNLKSPLISEPMSWYQILSSIVWGDLIYPI